MSLNPVPPEEVPSSTAQIAREAFPKGNRYIRLREEFGSIYRDEDFTDLYPRRGQPGYSPWRLALVTVFQFMEGLTDRQAARAVAARIDWKYALSLELGDVGFHYSVLSEFRSRLLEGGAEERLLNRLLEELVERGIVKARGRQRTDATRVIGQLRTLNRLELLGETMRAACNQVAAADPALAQAMGPRAWIPRYGTRVTERRLPKSEAKRAAYAEQVGADGLELLGALKDPRAEDLRDLPAIRALRAIWDRHFEFGSDGGLNLIPDADLPTANIAESPYEPDARYRRLSGKAWTGYLVHLTETCDEERPSVITNVQTTPANVHESVRTGPIHEDLLAKRLAPKAHLVDAGYTGADHVVEARLIGDIHLVGPMRADPNWQSRTPGAYATESFTIDWDRKEVTCPEKRRSRSWRVYQDKVQGEYVMARFSGTDCQPCPAKARCSRAKSGGRSIRLQPRVRHEALTAARTFAQSPEGRRLQHLQRGVESTISQGVRAFGLRTARYRGLAKTHLQHIGTAAAMNLARLTGQPEQNSPRPRSPFLRAVA